MKSAKQKERELIIKLSRERKTCRETAAILGVSKSKVSFWITRFKKTGSLKDKQRGGRPTPLTKRRLNVISKEIKSKIIEFQKKKKSGISSKEVMNVIEYKIGKKYTMRHIQRLLHKLGFSLITPRVSHIRRDREAIEKFRSEFKKNSRRNIWVIPS